MYKLTMIIERSDSTYIENTTFGALKLGNVVNIDSNPYKIVEFSKCKPGKHGVAKVNITGIDIFSNKKKEMMDSANASIELVQVLKHTYQLMNINDPEEENELRFLSLLDNKKQTIEHFCLPNNELGERILRDFELDKNIDIITTHALTKEMITDYEISNS